MTRKFRYTPKVIKEALKGSEMLCLKGLLAIWQYNQKTNPGYTDDVMEKFDGFTSEFKPSEASFMRSLAEQYQSKGYLSPNQINAVKRRMGKYSDYLSQIANMKNRLEPLEAKDPNISLEDGRQRFFFECKSGNDGPYSNPAIFFARSKRAVKIRIMLNNNDSLSLWVPLKNITLIIPGDDKEKPDLAYVGIPKWLCEKNKISLDLALEESEVPSIED